MVFELTANAEDGDGNVAAFDLRISDPEFEESRGYYCKILCPYIRQRSFRIFGVDEEQAATESIRFVRRTLSDMNVRLMNDDGVEVTLPGRAPA